MNSKKLVAIGYRPGRNSKMVKRIVVDVYGRRTELPGTLTEIRESLTKNCVENLKKINP